MKYYPVIIPTLNRYEHLKRLLDSLAKNTHAAETELVIGLDYPPNDEYIAGWKHIKAYLPNITGFKEVTILEATHNLGPAANNRQCIEYVKEKGYDAFICSEDDNEFSPNFLDYMDKALEKYKNNEKIYWVCGYTPFENNNGDNMYVARAMSAWGYGTWFHKRESVLRFSNLDNLNSILRDFPKSIKLYRLRKRSLNSTITQVTKRVIWGDSCCVSYCLLNNVYSLFPSISLVRNWGNDGTGINCKDRPDLFESQEISDSYVFNLDNVELEEKPEIYHAIDNIFKMSFLKNLAVLIRYIIYYIIQIDMYLLLFKKSHIS